MTRQTGCTETDDRMTEAPAATDIKYASISAVIIRADGTVEDLGVIAEIKPEPEPERSDQ